MPDPSNMVLTAILHVCTTTKPLLLFTFGKKCIPNPSPLALTSGITASELL